MTIKDLVVFLFWKITTLSYSIRSVKELILILSDVRHPAHIYDLSRNKYYLTISSSYPVAGTPINIMVDRRVVHGNTYSPFRLIYDWITYIIFLSGGRHPAQHYCGPAGNTYSPFRLKKYDLIIYIFSYPMAGTLPNIMVDRRVVRGNTYSPFRNNIFTFGNDSKQVQYERCLNNLKKVN